MRNRVARFAAVGLVGFLVQIGTLAWLTVAGWAYQPATILAVEIAVLHNFLWHERWTWRDRTSAGAAAWARLGRFQLTNGVNSLVGNLLLTAVGVELLDLHVVNANAIAVVLTALANYMAADRWVFRPLSPSSLVARPFQGRATRIC
jgi:putative flippase GtrA